MSQTINLKKFTTTAFYRCLAGIVVLSVFLAACAKSQPQSVSLDSCQSGTLFKVLVFTKTVQFRHASIENGVAMICTLGTNNNFSVTHSEDSAIFTEAQLQNYSTVVFLNTSGDILGVEQQQAFENYIQSGGGFAGIHAASDTEYDWQWYGNLLGTYFESHPAIQQANINVENNAHQSTQHLDATWIRTDEWYNFRTNPRMNVNVLLSLDESTYDGANMNADHPIAWYHVFDGGRSWYTALGHTESSYSEPDFQQHVLGGIMWSAGF